MSGMCVNNYDCRKCYNLEHCWLINDEKKLRIRNELLQSEILKKDQEIKRIKSLGMEALDFYIKATEMRHRNMMNVCDMALEVIDYAEGLEQQLAKQQAWIGKLEEGFIKEFTEHHASGGYGISQKELEAMWEKDRQRAREALEKLRTG